MIRILSAVILLACISCQTPTETKVDSDQTDKLPLKYAEGFSVHYFEGYKIVTVSRPFMGAKSGFEYVLVNDESLLPAKFQDKPFIKVPLESIVCTSTTHIPLLDYINETDKLVGFPTTDYISSVKMRTRIDSGLVTDLGVDKEMNLEQLIELDPSMVMAYTIGGDFGQFNKIEQMGIPVVLNAEYLEAHPLGRAEWIKFMAAFFNKEELADSVFNEIEAKYLELQTLAKTSNDKPSILSGIVYGDTWYLPGGNNYASKLMRDAGGNYLWAQDSSSGFLELSFESVYNKAADADYWIGVANYQDLISLKKADSRYAEFQAYTNKNVYTSNWRKGAKGGSEFLELGYLRPDLILADLIKILHPELLPEYNLYFHHRLE
ncbi:MAG TPA: ABC transporter substrate-binding protein [Fulvivirga sp.]|nr:ABC transporter substrate-binding protein [Fulvivirga sp.]